MFVCLSLPLAGSHLITAANFCMNGKLAVAGTYDGRCIFYETEVGGARWHRDHVQDQLAS